MSPCRRTRNPSVQLVEEAEADSGDNTAQPELGTSEKIIHTAAGNIKRYFINWVKITQNSFILRIVSEGYSIQFFFKSHLNNRITSNPLSPEKFSALRQEIAKHLKSGAISIIQKSSDQFVSRVFTVKKSNGEYRLIIDLSLLNEYIAKDAFPNGIFFDH